MGDEAAVAVYLSQAHTRARNLVVDVTAVRAGDSSAAATATLDDVR